jgi:hypothetical protein
MGGFSIIKTGKSAVFISGGDFGMALAYGGNAALGDSESPGPSTQPSDQP